MQYEVICSCLGCLETNRIREFPSTRGERGCWANPGWFPRLQDPTRIWKQTRAGGAALYLSCQSCLPLPSKCAVLCHFPIDWKVKWHVKIPFCKFLHFKLWSMEIYTNYKYEKVIFCSLDHFVLVKGRQLCLTIDIVILKNIFFFNYLHS